jgi:hypothetical protein
MAHHQGMSLLSFAHLLLDRPMQKRFEAATRCSRPPRCCLQERVPRPWPSIRAWRRFPTCAPAPAGGNAGARHPPPGHAVARTAAAVERPLPRDDHQRRRRVQPLERSGGDALARRRHLRQLGRLLLYPRPALGRVLVGRVPAGAAAIGQLRSDLLRRARRVPPPRPRLRHAYRDRRLAGGRYRVAAHQHHQHLALAQDDRSHQLRGGRAGLGGRRRAASGVQQPVRADRDPPRAAGDCAPAGRARAKSARRGCAT